MMDLNDIFLLEEGVMTLRGFVSIGRISRPIYCFSPHQHSSWEVIYYLTGDGELAIGDRVIPFHPGMMVMQPPGILHAETSDSGYENYHLMVRTVEWSGDVVPVVHDNESGDLLALFGMMYRLSVTQPKGWKPLVESLVATLNEFAGFLTQDAGKNRWVSIIEGRLVDNITNAGYRISDVYKGIPVSVDHLRRLFVSETGDTPSGYLTARRIDHAVRLMEAGYAESFSIKTIAAMCGYDDQYYFSRIFKKVKGTSPSRWKPTDVGETANP